MPEIRRYIIIYNFIDCIGRLLYCIDGEAEAIGKM